MHKTFKMATRPHTQEILDEITQALGGNEFGVVIDPLEYIYIFEEENKKYIYELYRAISTQKNLEFYGASQLTETDDPQLHLAKTIAPILAPFGRSIIDMVNMSNDNNNLLMFCTFKRSRFLACTRCYSKTTVTISEPHTCEKCKTVFDKMFLPM